MVDRYLQFAVLFLCSGFSSAALADLPITVEELITEKGKIKVDVSLSYVNAGRHLGI